MTNQSYIFKQGDIVSYSITNSKSEILKGTGIVTGIATNQSSLSETIYIVEDPENFPNHVYKYTTFPIRESNLSKVGRVEEKYLYISQDEENGAVVDDYKADYRKAKTRLLTDKMKNSKIVKVMNHNLHKVIDSNNQT